MSQTVHGGGRPFRAQAADVAFLAGGLVLEIALMYVLRTRAEMRFVRAVVVGHVLAGWWWGRVTATRALAKRGGLRRFLATPADFNARMLPFQALKAATLLAALMLVGAISAPVEMALRIRRMTNHP